MKTPWTEPALRELLALAALSAFGCGLALAQGDFLFAAIFCRCKLIDNLSRQCDGEMRLSEVLQLSHASDAKDHKQQGAVRADTMTARQCMVGAAEINDVRIDQLLPFQGSRTSLRRWRRLRTRNRPGFRRLRT